VRKVYAATFERLRELGNQVRAAGTEVQSMLGASFKDLNAEFGFSLLPPEPLQLHDFEKNLAELEESYLQYLGFGNVFKLANPLFGERLIKALGCGCARFLKTPPTTWTCGAKGPPPSSMPN